MLVMVFKLYISNCLLGQRSGHDYGDSVTHGELVKVFSQNLDNI